MMLFLAVALASFAASAQKMNEAKIYGQVKDRDTDKKLESVSVVVLKGGAPFDTYLVEGSGRYEFYVGLGDVYDVKFVKSGYVSKFVRVDLKSIPDEDRAGGFSLVVDMSLFPLVPNFNEAILNEPIGKASFNPIKNAMDWDYDYTARMQDKIDAEFERLKDLEANMEKLKKEFDDLMLKGDQKMLEKKYLEAMGKFEAALKIFPDDAGAKKKFDEAKKKYDEEMLAKDAEAKYQKYLTDGEKYLKAASYADARTNYKAALDMKPAERLPKDKLTEIDRLEAELGKREEFNALITAGEGKMMAQDFEGAIAKFEAADKLLPNETYPNEQIAKARAALDKLQSDEAKRLEREKRYNDLITLGERNFKAKDYMVARTNYVEAKGIKPEESLPQEKIDEIDALLAELDAKKQEEAAATASNAEKERIEKEYQQHINQANTLFDAGKLTEARAEYDAAHQLKLADKYPITRMARIDEMLAELAAKEAGDAAEKSRLAEEERLKREKEKKDQLAEEEKLAEADRQARLEKERLAAEEAAERKRLEEQKLAALRSEFNSNVDKSKEDEVEKYFREARLSADHAKYTGVDEDKEKMLAFHQSRSAEAVEASKAEAKEIQSKKDFATALKDNAENENAMGLRADEVNNEKDSQVRIMREGQLVNDRNLNQAEEKQAQIETNQRDYLQRADNMRDIAERQNANTKEAQQALLSDDTRRQENERKAKERRERAEEKQRDFASKGNAQRQINEYEVKKEKQNQESLVDHGEKIRELSQTAIEEKKEAVAAQRNDLLAASGEKQDGALNKIENTKESAARQRTEDNERATTGISDVEDRKAEQDVFYAKQNREATNRSFDKRDELFDKERGGEKSPDQYAIKPGTETLAQGVTENSYQLGNKIVIERTLKVANKVDYYKKVVSKTGIYYFKNDKAITEATWDFETLKQ